MVTELKIPVNFDLQGLNVHNAEKGGFEPPDPCRSTVFKTAAIDHSATSPLGLQKY